MKGVSVLEQLRIEGIERGLSDEQLLDLAHERGLMNTEPCPLGCDFDPDDDACLDFDPDACPACGGWGMVIVLPDNEDSKES